MPVCTWSNSNGNWIEIQCLDGSRLLMTEAEFDDLAADLEPLLSESAERRARAKALADEAIETARRKAAQRTADIGGRRWVIQGHPNAEYSNDLSAWLAGYSYETSPARARLVMIGDVPHYEAQVMWDERTRAANPDSPFTHYTLKTDGKPYRFKSIEAAMGMAEMAFLRAA